jgi:hypothetical protein
VTEAGRPDASGPAGPTYRYVRFGGAYVSLERDLHALAWPLLTCRPLRGVPRRGTLGFSSAVVVLQRLARLAVALAAQRLGRPLRRPILRLPVDGHVALPLNVGGYKIIDLKRRTVTTLFPRDGDVCPVVRHVRKSLRVGRRAFAPSVVRYDLRERILEEAFINGTPTATADLGQHAVDDVVVPLVFRIVTAHPPRRVGLADYLERRLRTMDDDLTRLVRAPDREPVAAFVRQTAARLRPFARSDVGLALSHGDVWQDNILTYRGAHYAIDWAASDYRSALYDLHFALFIPLETPQAPPLDRVRAALPRAVAALRRRLQERVPAHAPILLPPGLTDDALRWVFYLEFMASCLEDCRDTPSGAVTAHRTKRMRTFVDAFAAFERAAG